MKTVLLVVVFVHGLIHLLGFLKGWGISEIKELTLPISKTWGLLWLTALLLFLAFGILYFVENEYAWVIGLLAVVVSQVLIIAFWKDARFGTIPNIVILCISIFLYGQHQFKSMVKEEISGLVSSINPSDSAVVSESDIQDLPEPVRRWLHHSGILGKPHIYLGKVVQRAEMKMKPEQQNWLPATAVQYTALYPPAFIWVVDVKMKSWLHFSGRDKFEKGKGQMLIKVNSLIPVVNEKGNKLDEGTLQRYLGEIVWFPSLALSPYIAWEPLDENSAKATMTYNGTSGSGVFYFNSDGDFLKFSALRYKENTPEARRYEWVIQAEEYMWFEGIRVPSRLTATWKLEAGDWNWLKLQIVDIHYNENARINLDF
ncbi:MAG: hypothetical protein PWR20_1623 [Bacteroidales bacterium]|jgi:hypothetical protein|nr:hypothetical protein [Bacteroidales bacterium]NPV37232.1 hypothetical protein [Bacteroidales bacterium]